ncbi:MAG: carbamoyltransferase HypF [Brucellaceae bacterium]|nr:carbamoyltransferase HypF [Brucellaceae bacterium]
MTDPGEQAISIRITGLVQGVGFRPFVWNLAAREGITGRVLNDGAGVLVEAFGAPDALALFVRALSGEAPPLARVDAVTSTPFTGTAPPDFTIAVSRGGAVSTGIVPDAATCPQCLADIADPVGRRYRYPFTNCTHCGPRLSIVEKIPYDRANTSMRSFAMCEECQAEYENPADRRFHAQPNGCPRCGPRIWLENGNGRFETPDPIETAAAALLAGQIVAIRGLGGFHLACDATNEAAVAELRRRKRRDAKPLAVMMCDPAMVRGYARLGDDEARLLTSPAAPIVLLAKSGVALASGIAPGQDKLGVMLPYTPLHHLLADTVDRPLVMTSGNLSDEPQVTGNDEAHEKLASICDLFLMHDRDIVNRLDDSVMQTGSCGPSVMRRARGLAPAPLLLPEGFADAPRVLAFGGDLKSAFCLLDGGKAIMSQHMGDLEEAATQADFRANLSLYRRLFDFEPEVIAADLHDGYFSTRIAGRMATDEFSAAALVHVQHHHAHLAACLAENGVEPGEDRSIGIVLDGTGAGPDGTVWGGEILVGGYRGFERAAHFLPVALPGGDRASKEPWRNAIAHLHAAFGDDWRSIAARTGIAEIAEKRDSALIEKMIAQGVNSPVSSSAGRLFDAVAALLGVVVERQLYEGQAGMELEALARPFAGSETGYPCEMSGKQTRILSWRPLWDAMLRDMASGTERAVIAARFQNGLIAGLADAAARAASANGTDRVALSGGVMQNEILRTGLSGRLTAIGLVPLVHRAVPANDGGLALGQATIAATARLSVRP